MKTVGILFLVLAALLTLWAVILRFPARAEVPWGLMPEGILQGASVCLLFSATISLLRIANKKQ